MATPDPTFPITLNGLLIIWQLLGLPVLTAISLYVRNNNQQLREINKALTEMNGRVIKIETWQTIHEDKDDDRFGGIKRELNQIQVDLRTRPDRQSGGP